MSECLSLQLSKTIKTARHRVFAAWTRPEELVQWFAPGPLRVGNVTVDLREAGQFRLSMIVPSHQTGAEVCLTFIGTYEKVVPDELLRFRWEVEGDPGKPTLVSVAFKDVDGGTEISLLQEQIHNEELLNRNRGGWTGMMDKLARLCDAETVDAM